MESDRNYAEAAEQREHESRVARTYHQMEDTVAERPLSAVMLSFGIGLGVGVAVGVLLAGSMHSDQKTHVAQRVGQQLLDAISRVMPDSIAQRINA